MYRRLGTKHRIKLTKSRDGFGIKIAERDNTFGPNRPIYITAITTIGSAIKDGRLKEGDMLLEANGIDLTEKSLPEVTKMLKSVNINEAVEFVISRQDNLNNNHNESEHSQPNTTIEDFKPTTQEPPNDKSLIDLDEPDQDNFVLFDIKNQQMDNRKLNDSFHTPKIEGPGTYVYDVPVNDTKSAGLGLYLKYPSMDGKDLGIWIKNVITGGAAWKDGRLQPYDQILAINGINLTGLSNAEAYEALKAAIGRETSSNTIRLNIHRRDPSVVAEILQGATNLYDGSKTPDRIANTDSNSHSGSQSSNSHNDSAMSPQTQASNSLRFSSSAISQNTDYTNLPTITSEISTLPKTLEPSCSNNIDPASSVHSWDDESIDNTTGEERFQRDGFGRQSISEKRHAKLMAENTDTFKRNQRIREERELEKQRQISEQIAIKSEMKSECDRLENNIGWNSNHKTYHSTQNSYITSIPHQEHQSYNYDQTANQSLRVTRNRKINDSFRAAVDRSYDNSMNEYPMKYTQPINEKSLRMANGTRTSNSVANSTISTVNDERQLINKSAENGNPVHKKSSSLLTRFLKFGSMKKGKKKEKNISANEDKQPEGRFSVDYEHRQQASKSLHSRTHSSQAHPNSNHHNQMCQQHPFESPNNNINSHNIGYQSLRAKGPMTSYQYQQAHETHVAPHHATMSRLHTNTLSRPHIIDNYSKYSEPPMHHRIQQPHLIGNQQHIQHPHHMILHNNPNHVPIQGQMINGPEIDTHNGNCHPSLNQQWQQPIQGTGGLWVANTPICEPRALPANPIYGSANQSQHTHPVTLNHPTPFIPSINTQNPHNMIHLPSPVMSNHLQGSMFHQLHSQQPTQIYYYDY